MNDDGKIRVARDTQVFIRDLSELSPEKQRRTVEVIDSATKLEQARGWRLAWERTPRPYLLFLAYFIFLSSIGGFGFSAVSHIPEPSRVLFTWILSSILILPLLPISFLSIYYIIKINPHEKSLENKESDTMP